MCALLHKVAILSQTNVFPIKESAISLSDNLLKSKEICFTDDNKIFPWTTPTVLTKPICACCVASGHHFELGSAFVGVEMALLGGLFGTGGGVWQCCKEWSRTCRPHKHQRACKEWSMTLGQSVLGLIVAPRCLLVEFQSKSAIIYWKVRKSLFHWW